MLRHSLVRAAVAGRPLPVSTTIATRTRALSTTPSARAIGRTFRRLPGLHNIVSPTVSAEELHEQDLSDSGYAIVPDQAAPPPVQLPKIKLADRFIIDHVHEMPRRPSSRLMCVSDTQQVLIDSCAVSLSLPWRKRRNILARCPLHGGTFVVDDAVRRVAEELQATLVEMDGNDLYDLGVRTLEQLWPKLPDFQGRSLPYHPYRVQPPPSRQPANDELSSALSGLPPLRAKEQPVYSLPAYSAAAPPDESLHALLKWLSPLGMDAGEPKAARIERESEAMWRAIWDEVLSTLHAGGGTVEGETKPLIVYLRDWADLGPMASFILPPLHDAIAAYSTSTARARPILVVLGYPPSKQPILNSPKVRKIAFETAIALTESLDDSEAGESVLGAAGALPFDSNNGAAARGADYHICHVLPAHGGQTSQADSFTTDVPRLLGEEKEQRLLEVQHMLIRQELHEVFGVSKLEGKRARLPRPPTKQEREESKFAPSKVMLEERAGKPVDNWAGVLEPKEGDIVQYSWLKKVVARAVQTASQGGKVRPASLAVTYPDLLEASRAVLETEELQREMEIRIKAAAGDEEAQKKQERRKLGQPLGDAEDPKERVQNEDLNAYERRLLSCVVAPRDLKMTFNDVEATPQIRRLLQDTLTLPMRRPEAFKTGILSLYFITGILLFGPPGTGKTLLAQAVAKQSGSVMITITPSDIFDKYIGESEKKVAAIFSLARRFGNCVVFIDEIDAILGSREGSSQSTVDVTNQFMMEWDGLRGSSKGVTILGATNRPFALDQAVLRRMPHRILVDLPGAVARGNIFRIMLKEETLAPEVNLSELARFTPSYSGSDIKNVCVSAALDSIKSFGKEHNLYRPVEDLDDDPFAHDVLAPPEDGTLTIDGVPVPYDEVPKPALTLEHFKQAIKEVPASTSEKSAAWERLREWNAEFGNQSGLASSSRVGWGNVGFR